MIRNVFRHTLAAAVVIAAACVDHGGAPPSTADSSAANTPATAMLPEATQGFLYGRVTTIHDGAYEGRLRFGGDEEAFWGNYFNATKANNPWTRHALPEGETLQRRPAVFGIELPFGERADVPIRPFMARIGDIARIDARGRDFRVTLKSATVIALQRYAADDFADGIRVWDSNRGVVDLEEKEIRSIEFLPTAALANVPVRLHGTVRTAHAAFTGFIQWDREQCASDDQLTAYNADGEVRLRFGSIRSITRHNRDSSLFTLDDNKQMLLADSRDGPRPGRGVYVDDARYGRVLVSWDAFEGVDFSTTNSGPAYADYSAGLPLSGTVTTRDGRRLNGRLVYDLDESETTETLDAPFQGVDYTIPFSRIASIAPAGAGEPSGQRATITLHSGETLQLERTGDLGETHAGMLIFADGNARPAFVKWADVTRVEFTRVGRE